MRGRTRARVAGLAAIVLAALLGAATGCGWVFLDPDDPMLHLDALDPGTSRVMTILPGAPWISLGPDGEFGTADDDIRTHEVGDVDLVLRTGISGFTGPFPKSRAADVAPVVSVGGPGEAPAVAFVVGASDGADVPPEGNPVVSPSLEGVPMVIAAFGDLDADGFIGVTSLDGDDSDMAIEEAEFESVAVRLAIVEAGKASGEIRLPVGGPDGAEVTVVLAAGAYAGDFYPGYFAGVVPDGPVVATKLPFLPFLEPAAVIDYAFPPGPEPADPDRAAAIELTPAFVPDPEDARIGESLTVRTDGSEPTVDLVVVRSGEFVRLGAAQVPKPREYRSYYVRPIRPGLDEFGFRTPYEILQRLVVPDDGMAEQVEVRIVPLDAFGNIANLHETLEVSLETTGDVRIVSPDGDGDPSREVILVSDARGTLVLLDDLGGVFDDADDARLLIAGPGGLHGLDVMLPDPDVDDSGAVDAADLSLVELSDGFNVDDPEFDGKLDVNGDGSIDEYDLDLVEEHLDTLVSVP